MNRKLERAPERHGLLANGSSGRWDVAVDESLDQPGWSLELESPEVYLVFELQDLQRIREALRYLEQGPGETASDDKADLILGRFGAASVSLLWDDEDFPRCFLIIGPEARSTLRLSLDAQDIQMLTDALRQVVGDLPPAKDNSGSPAS